MSAPVDVRTLVRQGAARLAAAGVDSDAHDASAIVAHVLDVEPGRLPAQDTCTEEQARRIEELLDRRCARVPLQHLTGRAWFRRVSLAVGPGVFVPRPETEVMVEAVLAEVLRSAAEGTGPALVVDLCTGSGAIAASVAVEAPPGTRVVAVELSPAAHAWAVRNLAGLDVDLRLDDATRACHDLDGSVDVVVANPPYIPPGAVVRDPEVAEHDPAMALWGGGPDGLDVVRGVAERAAGLLRPGGFLAVEHADLQGPAVLELLASHGGYVDVVDHQDLAGRDRFTTARRASAGSSP